MSRRRSPLRLLPPSKPEPVAESAVTAAAAEAADGGAGDTFPAHDPERRKRDFLELVALARAPLEIDEPARRGGVDLHDGEEEIPERIGDDESPWDLLRRTQRSRDRRRREAMPDGVHSLRGAELVARRGVAAAAVAALRKKFPSAGC